MTEITGQTEKDITESGARGTPSRRRGRPPGRIRRPTTPDSPATAPATPGPGERRVVHLPKPPSTKNDPDAFFRYWHEVDKQFPDRVEVYVYRMWPVIDRSKSGAPNKTSSYVEIWRGAFDPSGWRDEMLHRLGSGDYKLYLKDTTMRRGVCWTAVRGLNDPDYPPVVNPEELVLEHPANRSYVEQLRIKGVLPSKENTEPQTTRTEGERVTAEAIRELASIVRQVLNESIQSRSKDTGGTLERSIEIVGEAAKAQSQLLANAYREALSAQNPTSVIEIVRHLVDAMQSKEKQNADAASLVEKIANIYKDLKPESQPSPDPVAVVERVASTLEKLAPKSPNYSELISPVVELFKAQIQAQSAERKPSGNQEVVEIMRAMLEQQRSWSEQVIRMQQEQISQMRHELAEARKQASDTSGITGVLETVARLKEQLSDILVGPGPEKKQGDWVDTVARLSPVIGPAVTAIAQRIASPPPPVPSYGSPPALPPGIGQAQPVAAPTPGGSADHPQEQIQAQPAQAQQPMQQPHPPAIPTNVLDAVPGLADAIVRYLNDGRTGDELAASLADWYGMLVYQQIRNLGPEALMQHVQSHPVVGQLAANAGQQLQRFISDFVNAESYWSQEEPDAEDTPAEPAASSATTDHESRKAKKARPSGQN